MALPMNEVLPGVYHLTDEMGVCMTLLAGEQQALLVDTGYGFGDPLKRIRAVTDKPLHVLLTHGHHDHALGAMHFDRVWLFDEDRPVYDTYTRDPWRSRAADQAKDKGIPFDRDAWLSAPMPEPEQPPGCLDLGGMTARIILCPGHTPGSAVVWVPERELLLTGDDWNPVTWLFFREALPVREYRQNVRRLAGLPFRHVLCSHREGLWPRETFTAFLDGLTDACLAAAEPSGEGAEQGIATATAHPAHEQALVFDRAKL